MADSETQQPVEQQVTSKTPTTRPKNPKHVAAGKAIVAKTKQAREAQKKALAEGQVIIANNQLNQAEPPAFDPLAADTPLAEPAKNVLTTTQWLSIISIVVSLAGIYYKRKEIKSVLTKTPPQVYTPLPVPPKSPVDLVPKRNGASNRWIKNELNFSHHFYNNGCFTSNFHKICHRWNFYGLG